MSPSWRYSGSSRSTRSGHATSPGIDAFRPLSRERSAPLPEFESRLGRRSGVQQLLDDHAVPPRPFELAVPMVDADLAETAPTVEREACSVLRKDARDDLPEPALGVGAAEGIQRHAARAGASRG